MANAGDHNPPLPDTDDPFVLLGVTPDADAKSIRQAYARLIRLYRPDRSPSEFQRVHAAFEAAKQLQGGVDRIELDRYRVAPKPTEVPEARPGPAPSSPIAERLEESKALAAAGDLAGAAAIVDQLFEQRVPLDQIFDAPTRWLVVRHPGMSWTKLSNASDDLDAIGAAFHHVWTDAFRRDPARAHALLDDSKLLLDAADHPQLAAECLLRIGALAWKLETPPTPLFDRYRGAVPMHPALDRLFDSVALDLAAAATFQGRTLRMPLRVLPDLLVAARIGTADERQLASRRLLVAIDGDLRTALNNLSILNRSTEMTPLFELLFEHMHRSATQIDRLGKPALDRLGEQLSTIGFQPRWRRIAALAGLVVAAAIIAVVYWSFEGVGIVTSGSFLIYSAYRVRDARRWPRIRTHIARLLLTTPVTTLVLWRWITRNKGSSGRLWRLRGLIANEAGLYALSMLSAAALSIGE